VAGISMKLSMMCAACWSARYGFDLAVLAQQTNFDCVMAGSHIVPIASSFGKSYYPRKCDSYVVT